jgi:hypothetical protein
MLKMDKNVRKLMGEEWQMGILSLFLIPSSFKTK